MRLNGLYVDTKYKVSRFRDMANSLFSLLILEKFDTFDTSDYDLAFKQRSPILGLSQCGKQPFSKYHCPIGTSVRLKFCSLKDRQTHTYSN